MKKETKNLAIKSFGMFFAVAGVSLLIFSGCSKAQASELNSEVGSEDSLFVEAAKDKSVDLSDSAQINVSGKTILALKNNLTFN